MEKYLGVIAAAGMVALVLGFLLTPVATILEETGQKQRADNVGNFGVGMQIGGLCLALVAAIIVIL